MFKRYTVIAGMVFFILISSVVWPETNKEAYRHVHKGRRFHDMDRNNNENPALREEHLNMALKYYKKAMKIFKENSSIRGMAETYNDYGIVYNDLGQLDKAKKSYEKSLELKRKLKYWWGAGNSYTNLGYMEEEAHNLTGALNYYLKALEMYKKGRKYFSKRNKKSESSALIRIGEIYQRLEDHHKAIDYYEKGLEIAEQINEYSYQEWAIGNLGRLVESLSFNGPDQNLSYTGEHYFKKLIKISYKLGDHYNSKGKEERARYYYRLPLNYRHTLNDPVILAQAWIGLGGLDEKREKFDSALIKYNTALEIAQKNNKQKLAANIRNMIGTIHMKNGDHEKAEDYFSELLKTTKNVDCKRGTGRIYSNLAMVYSDWGKIGKAVEYANKALKIAKEINQLQDQHTAVYNLSQIYESNRQYIKALDLRKQALLLARKAKDPYLINKTRKSMRSLYNEVTISAAANNKIDIMKTFLSKGARINANATCDNHTALTAAAENGCKEALEFLIEKGANVNKPGGDGMTALAFASGGGRKECIKILLDNNAKVNPGNSTFQPLYEACRQGRTQIVKLLIKKGADVNATNLNGQSALLIASKNGYTNIVRALLENGANIAIQDSHGNTPLILASKKGALDTVKLLAKRGAALESVNQQEFTALGNAAMNGRKEVVEFLKSVGSEDYGEGYFLKIIFNAVNNNDLEKISEILDSAVDVNVQNHLGASPLLVASNKGYIEIVRLLLDKGADIELRNHEGLTPLMGAALNNEAEDVVELLLKKGANAREKTLGGKSAMDLAASDKIRGLIKKYGSE